MVTSGRIFIHDLTISEGASPMPQTFKPGEMAPRSGQYEIIGKRGGHIGDERTATKGKPLPPTPQPGQVYQLVDPTRNDSGKA